MPYDKLLARISKISSPSIGRVILNIESGRHEFFTFELPEGDLPEGWDLDEIEAENKQRLAGHLAQSEYLAYREIPKDFCGLVESELWVRLHNWLKDQDIEPKYCDKIVAFRFLDKEKAASREDTDRPEGGIRVHSYRSGEFKAYIQAGSGVHINQVWNEVEFSGNNKEGVIQAAKEYVDNTFTDVKWIRE